jgi:hypothetical protein
VPHILKTIYDKTKWKTHGNGTIVAVEEKFRKYNGSLQKFYKYDVEIQYNNMTVRQMTGSSNVYHIGSEVDYYMEGTELKINDGSYISVNSAADLVGDTQSSNTTNRFSISKKIFIPIIIICVLLLDVAIFKPLSFMAPFIGLGIIVLFFYFLFDLRKKEKVKATKMQSNIDDGIMYKIDAKVIEIKIEHIYRSMGTRSYMFFYAIILYQDANGYNRLGQIRMTCATEYSVNSTIQVYYNSLTHAMIPIL